MNIVAAVEHEKGAIGLWETITSIIGNLMDKPSEFILLCEDDHQFTCDYSAFYLMACIQDALERGADILLGGVSSVRGVLPVSKSLFWAHDFSGLQFTIIFRKFFDKLLDASFGEGDSADHKIASLTEHVYLIHPFVSTQKYFGYSDVTVANNEEGRILALFEKASESIGQIIAVESYYRTLQRDRNSTDDEFDPDGIVIPTYIMNLPERTDRLEYILGQFSGKGEFEVVIIEASRHVKGAMGLWQSIRRIIEIALVKQEDVVIICEDDHEFTENYDKAYLIEHILEAHSRGADILICGLGGGFSQALPISDHLYWVNYFYGAQFIVVYRKLFQRILDEPFDDHVLPADDLLSQLTSHKMVLYPSISVQKGFGYPDVTTLNNVVKGRIGKVVVTGRERMEAIRRASMRRSV